jgi:hypothetical protein
VLFTFVGVPSSVDLISLLNLFDFDRSSPLTRLICSITICSESRLGGVKIDPEIEREYFSFGFSVVEDFGSFGRGGRGIGTIAWDVPLGFEFEDLTVKRPILS